MTKKRFIKLVMSKGKGRNEAQRIAEFFNFRRVPYDKAYKIFMLSNSFAGVMDKLKNECKRCTNAIMSLAIGLKKLKAFKLADKPTVETEGESGQKEEYELYCDKNSPKEFIVTTECEETDSFKILGVDFAKSGDCTANVGKSFSKIYTHEAGGNEENAE